MKIWKRIIGIVLTLALILQCGQGIVISKAQPGNTVTIDSNGTSITGSASHSLEQWWDNGAIDLTVTGLNPGESYMYECQFVDSSGTAMTPLTGIANQASYHIGSLGMPYRWDCSLTAVIIKGVYRISSAYSWMNVSITADGSYWTVTNTSSNNVTGFVMNGETIEEALGLNQTSTPRPLPPANADGIVELNLSKADYVSVAAMYPDAQAMWFVPTSATMKADGAAFRLEWSLANNSTDYRVNSYNLSLHYRVNGQDQYQTRTETTAVDARGNTTGSMLVGDGSGSFEFLEFTIQNVSYTKDIDPNLEHTALSGPTVATSSLNYKTYVTWSLVNFGTYALQADGGTGPIEWRVLEYNENMDQLVLMANKALFSMAYEPTMFGSTWESSSLRNYLNGTFWTDAFTVKQRNAIFRNLCKNSAPVGSHSVSGADTWDYVYILSVAELNDPKYGLYGGDSTNSVIETRQFEATEATLTNTNLTKKTYAGQTFVNYFLRTPGYYQYDVAGVAPSGILNASGWRTYTKTAAVCPVIRVSRSGAEDAGLTWKGSIYKQVPAGYNTAAASSVKVTPTKKLKALSVGDTKMVNNVTYEVTQTTNKSKTVAVAGVKKSAKKVVIPSTIKVNGATYKVTKIKANAFKKAKNNLNTITIKSKNIKTMNKKAFNGLTKKTTVKISKAQYKKYKKLIKNNKLTIKKLS